jgi:hypothetical protein
MYTFACIGSLGLSEALCSTTVTKGLVVVGGAVGLGPALFTEIVAASPSLLVWSSPRVRTHPRRAPA